MRVLILVVMICLITSICSATTTTKVGFAAISSSSSKTCNVMGMKKWPLNTTVPQVFTPDTDLSRSYLLGTKGYANYSTIKGTAFVVKFTCNVTGTDTTAPVKLYLNGVQTYFLTLDQGEIGINP